MRIKTTLVIVDTLGTSFSVHNSLLKCLLTQREQQTMISRNHVMSEVHGVRFIESQNNKIVFLVTRVSVIP